MKKITKIVGLALVMILVMSLFQGCGDSSDSNVIRVTHKDYTEQRLMGKVLYTYLLSKGYEATINEMGTTLLCFNAIKEGKVDIYPEYTGSAYAAILDQSEIITEEETFNYVKEKYDSEFDIHWMKPYGFNNTYVFSVREDTMKEYGLKTISDLVPYSPKFTLGCDNEFPKRLDGYPGLQEMYPGLDFKELVSMNQSLTYQALAEKEIDVNVSYSTDGRIAKYNLKNLEDDKGYFVDYHCATIVRNECLEKHPNLEEDLKALEGVWNEEDMQRYNLMVDEGADMNDVAKLMLQEAGLLDE